MSEAGRTALAELLRQLREADSQQLGPQASADLLWPTFRAAVQEVLAELKEEDLEGLARWRAARHGEAEE